MTQGAGASEGLELLQYKKIPHARRRTHTLNSVRMGLILSVWLLSDVSIDSGLRLVI